MNFRLEEMINIKTDERSIMKSIIDKIKTRNRPIYNIKDTLNDKVNIISELKHSSPSAGKLSGDLEDAEIVKRYINGGASAISVLTEKNFFDGSYDHLQSVTSSCGIPVLCKDFIYFEEQIEAAYLCGADMVLLISRTLDRSMLKLLYDKVINFGMTPIIEIHEEKEIENILSLKPELVLVNMRNLGTLQMDFSTGIETLKKLPQDIIRISASGIYTRNDISYVMNSTGTNNFLIGTSLMKNGDPEGTLRKFKDVY